MAPAKKEALLFTIAYTVFALTFLEGFYRLLGWALMFSLFWSEKKNA